MHPKDLKIEDYTYDLPDERIAKYPLDERDGSKLLIYDNGNISEDIYKNIAAHIPQGSLMVFNHTKVVNARLLFKKPSGSTIEVFCLAPHSKYSDIQTAMLQKKQVEWECLVGGAGKWKEGMILQIQHNDPAFTLSVRIVERRQGSFVLNLQWDNDDLTFAEILHFVGKVPLPPYLHRNAEIADESRYQTVFAREEGSVAAPTAGLHFTGEVMESLAQNNIETAFVTLHVGAGTFKPVKSTTMEDHDMHAEWIEVNEATIIQLINAAGRNVIAVGTTSLRTLESLYWIGAKLLKGEMVDMQSISVDQWDAYTTDTDTHVIQSADALGAVLTWMRSKKLDKLVTRTRIFIAPGYTFRIVNGLVTNFHQPQSTLLLLVAALIGQEWRQVYNYAMDNGYRFLSYGDGSLLWRAE